MADSPEQQPKSEKMVADTELPRWLRTIGAGATVFVALVGVGFTAYQLHLTAEENREKAQFDKDTSYNNSIAERYKLQLGLKQIEEQEIQFNSQSNQHKMDLDIEIKKHNLDLQQQKDQAKDAAEKAERDALAALINKLFRDENSEGDIASLFQYVSPGSKNQAAVENALLARLERPKSREEIEIGFRVLGAIGPSTLETVIRANCSARNTLDEMLYRTFSHYFNQASGGKGVEKMTMSEVLSSRKSALFKAMNETYLDGAYAEATINDKTLADWNAQTIKQDTDEVFRSARESIALAQDVIVKSNLLINNFLQSWDRDDKENIDFASAYLTDSVALAVYPDWLKRRVRCNGCFASGNSRPSESLLGASSWLDAMPGSVIIGNLGDNTNPLDFMLVPVSRPATNH